MTIAAHVAALCSLAFVGVIYRQSVSPDFRLGGSLYQAYVDACMEQTLIPMSFTKRFEILLEFRPSIKVRDQKGLCSSEPKIPVKSMTLINTYYSFCKHR